MKRCTGLPINHALLMQTDFKLSKQQIIAALTALNARLAAGQVTGEVCIFGGAAMVLAFDARESTRDVHGVFVPKSVVAECSRQVAEEHGLPESWLNDGVKGWVSAAGDLVADGMPQFSHLRVLRPTAEYLLAMKCLASRTAGYDGSSDKEDVRTLVRHLGLKDVTDVLNLVCRYYPESKIGPKTRYFVEELLMETGGEP